MESLEAEVSEQPRPDATQGAHAQIGTGKPAQLSSTLVLLAQLLDGLGPRMQKHPLRTVVVFQVLGLAPEQS